MKNVLVFIHDDPGQESRLQVALDLTHALGGHLACLHFIPPDVPSEAAIAVQGDKLLLNTVDREEAYRATIQRRLASEEVPWTWMDTGSDPGTAMHDAFALSDIIVANRALETCVPSNLARVAAHAIIATGKSVAAVPEGSRGLDAFGCALIAWDGSDQASAAVTACVPLLREASRTILLEIDGGDVDAPADEAAAYLSLHGIQASIEREARHKASAAELISAAAEKYDAAYIVMGGFGHSRLSEALFGGASHDLLRSSSIPLLMVH